MDAANKTFPGDDRRLTVAVTGASGFVGSALVAALARDARFSCRACYRTAPRDPPPGCEIHITGDLGDSPSLSAALIGADVVVHAAARAHIIRELGSDGESAYHRTNVDATLSLARAAAENGVRRFVFLSSVGVHGDATPAGKAFVETDAPSPQSPYARSKLDAEIGLQALADVLEVVVLRAPLVHGPGAPGNLGRLLSLVRRGWPIPLGSVRNRRSLLGIDNLCAAILAAITHPDAAGRTLLVSDQDDVSTPEIIAALARGADRRALLVPCPPLLLDIAGGLIGRSTDINRLVRSLQVDSSLISRALGWQPMVAAETGLARMAAGAEEPLQTSHTGERVSSSS